jgi:hypothetical protein
MLKLRRKKKKKIVYAESELAVHARCLEMKGPPIRIERYRGNYCLATKHLLLRSLNSAITPHNLESAMHLLIRFFFYIIFFYIYKIIKLSFN